MLNSFASSIEISVASQSLFTVAGFSVTNTLLTGFISTLALLGVFAYVIRKVQRGEYNRFVGLVQWAFEGMLGQIESVIPDKKLARKVMPLALSIFFVMLASYWMSVLPGLDSIRYHGVPILRSLASDLNFTLVVSLIVFVMVQFLALQAHGPIGNAKRYLRNPIKDPIGSFEGILELIGEVSRYSALAVRMFGNCFAGEILLIIIAVLTSYVSVVMLPFFMVFELFIGFVQAYVFFILTVIFTSLAVETHGDSHSSDHSPAETAKNGKTAVRAEMV
ncbi:MAG: synthase subunit a [Candidatus Saccharibacteria bacterium]|nr:synthase subunit a [Candidatus Saccharibacteria bacterium]